MVKQTIQIFARIKPTKVSKAGLYDITEEQDGCMLNFTLPRELSEGLVNNKRESFKYRFEQIFDQSAKQDEVFEQVARPVVDNVLQGYNGTIFAYGQTGSGKTFTITGGPEKYSDRGIIPRTVSYIFDHQSKSSDFEFTTHVSYLEIYNENGYDLLDPKHEASKLEDLPKVSLMEDSKQNIHLRNLSTHKASTEEEALNLLFLGDTNRMIAETPMNQASTRSHCIFTIHVSAREAGSATIRRAKLHLVDLAGSERVSKTGVNGVLLTEAKYINLSLHFLEQVIVALGERTRSHIPYRNSMMTSVLRDSLGGNCMTTMIATCSIEKRNLAESISTCNFAQRVALIKNDAILNEELDPKLVIARLKREVEQLKEELAMATGVQRSEELSEEDLERCEDAVRQYLEDRDPDSVINIGADMRKIHRCFHLLKKQIKAPPSGQQAERQRQAEREEALPTAPAESSEVSRLQQLISQRDNEINILVNMLKKEKKRAADAAARLHSLNPEQLQRLTDSRSSEMSVTQSRASVDSSIGAKNSELRSEEQRAKKMILGEMSLGRQEAFETFRRDYQKKHPIEDSKRELKMKYAEAKGLGEKVNVTRGKINKLKSSLEQHRMSRVMQGLVDPENPEPDEMEMEMRSQMETEKQSYKEAFAHLRSLKTEIEHSQHLLEKSKVQLMKDFEIWWAEQTAALQEKQSRLNGGHRSAWRTPSSRASSLSTENSRASLYPDSVVDQAAGRHHGNTERKGLSSVQHRGGGSPQQRSGGEEGGGGSGGVIPLTGDAKADADIMAFMRARQHIAQQAQSRR